MHSLCSKEITVTYDFLVFIGRFQPYHLGHQLVVDQALASTKKLIILIGSSHRPRCPRNPWTFAERERMIRSTLHDQERVIVAPLMDATYNDDLWLATVQQSVNGIVAAHHTQPHRDAKIALIGHAKDRSSYYLKCFPQWESVDVPAAQPQGGTAIRAQFLGAPSGAPAAATLSGAVPAPVCELLDEWINSPDGQAVREEFAFVQRYRSAWDDAPYPPTFVTVDAVVVQSGHVLLVERAARPGKGLWALPGGFVDPSETLRDAMIRELKEETRIKVPLPVLLGSIKNQDVFDDPHRSARGRTLSHAFYIALAPDTALPKVRGSDDAKRAFWMPLAHLDPSQLFEDHYFSIQRLVGQLA